MQFKLAMERITNKNNHLQTEKTFQDTSKNEKDILKDPLKDIEDNNEDTSHNTNHNSHNNNHNDYNNQTLPEFALFSKEHSKDILNYYIPLFWILLFVLIMNRDSIISTIYMPFLGIFAACLANTVPIGGGVVYVPALLLLGVELKLGVSFTVATMSFGNGLFGFLRWLNKDSNLIIWDSFWYTIIPSYIGSLIAIFILPAFGPEFIKSLFAIVCLSVAILIFIAVSYGGLEKIPFITIISNLTSELELSHTSSSNSSSLNSTTTSNQSLYNTTNKQLSSTCQYTLIIITFLGGLFLVPNIGVGPALTTYLILNIFGINTKAAVVTGIITGGWVCILPFLIHVVYFQDIPYELWLMVIPGVYIGAAVSFFLQTIVIYLFNYF